MDGDLNILSTNRRQGSGYFYELCDRLSTLHFTFPPNNTRVQNKQFDGYFSQFHFKIQDNSEIVCGSKIENKSDENRYFILV